MGVVGIEKKIAVGESFVVGQPQLTAQVRTFRVVASLIARQAVLADQQKKFQCFREFFGAIAPGGIRIAEIEQREAFLVLAEAVVEHHLARHTF